MRVRRCDVQEQPAIQPGREDEGDRQRDQHAGGSVDRDGAHVGAHQAGDEGHGQQGCDHGERRQDGRTADFVHRRGNRLGEILAAELHVAVDVLDHHDCVIHQDADGEDQREQRHAVEREAPGPGCKQRDGEGDDDGGADHERLAPAQREQDQHDNRGRREDQFLDQRLRLVLRRHAVVARNGCLHAIGEVDTAHLLEALDDRAPRRPPRFRPASWTRQS